MSRLIDADELTKDIEYSADMGGVLGKVVEYVKYYAKYMVASSPTIEERKTGHWINAYPDIEPNPMFMYGICSICGCEQSISNKLKFCPDCGAYMRGREK